MDWTSYLVWWPSNPCGFNTLNQSKIGKWGLLARGFYEQTCRCPKVFKRDFNFNLSHVLSPYRRLNFTLWELILPHIAVLLQKIHPCLNLQHFFSLFFSALPNVRPTKGDLVYISSTAFVFTSDMNWTIHASQHHVTVSATLLTSCSNLSWPAGPCVQLTAKSETPFLIKPYQEILF